MRGLSHADCLNEAGGAGGGLANEVDQIIIIIITVNYIRLDYIRATL